MKLLSILLVLVVLLTCASAASRDHYAVLGVDRQATERAIQKAFRKLSLKYHPDKNKAKSAASKMAELTNAYEVLSDKKKRAEYDLQKEGDVPGFERSGFSGGFPPGAGRGGGGQEAGGFPGAQTFQFGTTGRQRARPSGDDLRGNFAHVFANMRQAFGGRDPFGQFEETFQRARRQGQSQKRSAGAGGSAADPGRARAAGGGRRPPM